MQLRSWLTDALRAFRQRRAYKGRHWVSGPTWAHVLNVPGQVRIPAWRQPLLATDREDRQWAEALHSLAVRRSVALAMQ